MSLVGVLAVYKLGTDPPQLVLFNVLCQTQCVLQLVTRLHATSSGIMPTSYHFINQLTVHISLYVYHHHGILRYIRIYVAYGLEQLIHQINSFTKQLGVNFEDFTVEKMYKPAWKTVFPRPVKDTTIIGVNGIPTGF